MFFIGSLGFNDDWRTAFYVPAFFATLVAIFVWFTVRDTPSILCLPPIEEHKDDYPDDYDTSHEKEMTAKEIFLLMFFNKLLWSIAIANAFVYLIRYGVLDWLRST